MISPNPYKILSWNFQDYHILYIVTTWQIFIKLWEVMSKSQTFCSILCGMIHMSLSKYALIKCQETQSYYVETNKQTYRFNNTLSNVICCIDQVVLFKQLFSIWDCQIWTANCLPGNIVLNIFRVNYWERMFPQCCSKTICLLELFQLEMGHFGSKISQKAENHS